MAAVLLQTRIRRLIHAEQHFGGKLSLRLLSCKYHSACPNGLFDIYAIGKVEICQLASAYIIFILCNPSDNGVNCRMVAWKE